MAHQLSAYELDKSLRGFLGAHWVTVISIIKGVAIGVAVVNVPALHEIPLLADRIGAWLLWLAALLAVLMTYQSVMIGTVLVYRYPFNPDLVFPWILGLVESLLFLFIVPIPQITNWLWTFLAFHVVCVAFIFHVYITLDRHNYNKDLETLIQHYKEHMEKELTFALCSSAVVGGIALLLHLNHIPEFRWLPAGLGVIFAIEMMAAMNQHRSTRRQIFEDLELALGNARSADSSN